MKSIAENDSLDVATASTLPSAKWVLELVGPTGTGKSHLLDYLRETRGDSDGFLTEWDFQVNGRLEGSLSPSPQTALLKFIYANQLIDVLRRNQTLPFLEIRIEIQAKKVNNELSWHASPLDVNDGAKKVLVVDHSLIHFNSGFLRVLQRRRGIALRHVLHHRAVALCTADPEVNVERICERLKVSDTHMHQRARTSESLLRASVKGHERFEELATWLESVGVPVLRLDLGRPLEESKAQLTEFAQSLR